MVRREKYGYSTPFVWDTSPKSIDCKGLGESRTGPRQAFSLCVKTNLPAKLSIWKCIPPSCSFSYERSCEKTRFETEAQGISEMSYYNILRIVLGEYKASFYFLQRPRCTRSVLARRRADILSTALLLITKI